MMVSFSSEVLNLYLIMIRRCQTSTVDTAPFKLQNTGALNITLHLTRTN